MYKLCVFLILLGINIPLFGRDTTLYKIVTSTKPIRSLTKLNGNIIVTRYDGVFEFDGENFFKISINKEKIKVTNNPNENWAKLVNPKLDYAQVELSNEGIYWVLIKNRFIYGFKIADKLKKSLPDLAIRGIYANNHSLLVSTYKGFYLNQKLFFPETLIFSNSNIIEEKGHYYFVANSEMIYKMSIDGSELEKIIHRSQLEKINNASVLIFHRGKLYIGGEKGLVVYNQNKKIQILKEGIDIHNLNIINDKLWISGSDGVYVLENKNLKRVFKINNSTGIFDLDGLIVSTSFEGLWTYDIQKNRLKNILKGSPYEKLETDAFYEDNYGNFWISTIHGFFRYNRQSKKISTFLEGTEFNRRSYFFKGDTIYLGSNGNGLIRFDIKELIAEDGVNDPAKENFRFFYIATVIFMVGLLIVFFIRIIFTPVNIIVDPPKVEVEKDENVFFSSLENYIRDHIDEVNVDQIRYQSGLTKYAFYTKFMDYFGKKPKEYLSEIKIKILQEKQNELLKKRNSLEEI
jgi:hypothetical protein